MIEILTALAVSALMQDADPRDLAAERTALSAPRETHPFSPEVYAERRRALMEALGPGLTIVDSASEVVEGRQNADFAYLTGIHDEANARVVMALSEDGAYQETLFLATYTPESDIWEGERLPISETIRERSGFERVSRMDRFQSAVPLLAARHETLHYIGPLVGPDRPVPAALKTMRDISARVPGTSVSNRFDALATLRAVKEPRELALMQRATDITVAGQLAGMCAARVGGNEFDIQQAIETRYIEEGARHTAFSTIVGSGHNSAILHYVRNDREIQDGDLVLVDTGAEYQTYAADITRTYPANGRFSDRQRQVYDIVLEVQEQLAAALRPGVSINDLNDMTYEAFRAHDLRDAFPHGVSHFVGLQVRDAGLRDTGLPVNAVITIEPGLYLPEEGFGIRIEDQYRVTGDGAERMSNGLPRTADDVEAYLARCG